MAKLEDMPNISTVAAAKLRAAGIDTPEDLQQLGSREAFLRVRLHADPGACFSMLQGLEGAVQNIRWHHLPADKKQELKTFYDSL